MADQLRFDALGCVNRWIQTPHIDRLAAGGVRFEQCVTTSPVCIPARFSFALGQYPHNTGIWKNGSHTLWTGAPTWMQAIREAGYRTSLFGKTHLHPHGENRDLRDAEHLLHAYGLDDVDEVPGPRACTKTMSHMTAGWREAGLLEAYQKDYAERLGTKPHVVRPSTLPIEHYYDTYVGRRACEYLRDYSRDEPWFCWVSLPGPHEPWDTPEPWASLHDPAGAPPPRAAPTSATSERPRGRLDKMIKEDQRYFEAGETQRLWADYAGSVALIDDQIGQILRALAERGELDRTVIVLTSDHGEMNGDAGLIYKETFLDPAVRVPLIVCDPRRSPQRHVSGALVEWIDVGPTLTELAGGTLRYRQFGQSLTPVLDDPAQGHRAQVISEVHGELMVMTGAHKAMFNDRGELYALFDRAADAGESRNLAGQRGMKAVAADLTARGLGCVMSTQTTL